MSSKSLNLYNKIDELIETESIFPAKNEKHNLSKCSLTIAFLRDIHEGNLQLEDIAKEQSHLVKN